MSIPPGADPMAVLAASLLPHLQGLLVVSPTPQFTPAAKPLSLLSDLEYNQALQDKKVDEWVLTRFLVEVHEQCGEDDVYEPFRFTVPTLAMTMYDLSREEAHGEYSLARTTFRLDGKAGQRRSNVTRKAAKTRYMRMLRALQGAEGLLAEAGLHVHEYDSPGRDNLLMQRESPYDEAWVRELKGPVFELRPIP